MKGICYFHLFNFISALYVATCSKSTKNGYEICQVDNYIKNNFTEMYEELFCNRSITCNKLRTTLRKTVNASVIIIHRHEWDILFDISNSFWNCGIKTVAIDATNSNFTFDIAPLCQSRLQTVVFSVTDLEATMNDFTQNICINQMQLTRYQTLERLLQYCPNMIYIQHINENCKNTKLNVYQLNHFDNSSSVAYKTIHVVTNSLSKLPFIGVSKPENENETTNFTGIVFELLKKIATELNFNFTVQEPPDAAWGIFANGSWNGMIGMLHRKEVDMAVGPLTITYERSRVVDFCSPFYFETMGILIKISTDNLISPWKFIFLFTWMAWLAIWLSGIVASIYLYIVNMTTPVDSARGTETLKSCIWFVYSVLVNQCASTCLGAWSKRTFVTFWRICAFILISIYISGLVAVLSVNKLTLPFHNLEELAKAVDDGQFKLCIDVNTAFHASIMKDEMETMHLLRKWLLNNPKYINDNCLDILIKEENVAYIAEVTSLKYFQNEHCVDYSFVLLDDRFYPGYFGFAMQKNSPYNSIISDKMTETIENGLIELWNKIYSTKENFCKIIQSNEMEVATNKQLKIFDLLGAFYVLIIGLIVSFIGFVIEFLLKRLCAKWFDEVKFMNKQSLELQHNSISKITIEL